MIHRHRPLGQRVDRVFDRIDVTILERRIPDRQRVHRDLDAPAQMLWRLAAPYAFGGKLELAQRFDVKLEDVGLDHIVKAHLHRPVLIFIAEGFVIGGVVGDMFHPEAAIVDIGLQLVGVHFTPAMIGPIPTEARQRADARAADVVGDVIGVILVFRAAVFVHKAGHAEPRAQIAEHRLEAAHVAVRLHHRPADRVRHRVAFADRAVQQADAVVTLQIGRVGQDQVGVGHHFGRIGIRIDDAGDDVVAVFVLVGQHVDDAGGIHRRIPRHVRHIHEKRVDLVRIARMGVRDHHMHQPMGRHRVVP